MKNGWLHNFILVLILLLGIALLLYPTVSDQWNSMHQTRAITNYVTAVNNLDKAENDAMRQAAMDYNRRRAADPDDFWLDDDELEEYHSLLNVAGDGIMGYVEVPTLNLALPIYHGTSNAVLEIGIGHMEFSSLPVGGIGAHTIISGHRGLPTARLFTDLDKLVEGDIFRLRVLDDVLTYQVEQILIVLPSESDALKPIPGKDCCTMVTCTPYGLNTHRLLIRGVRISEEQAAAIQVSTDAVQIEKRIVTPILMTIILLLTTAILLTGDSFRVRRRKQVQRLLEQEEKEGNP